MLKQALKAQAGLENVEAIESGSAAAAIPPSNQMEKACSIYGISDSLVCRPEGKQHAFAAGVTTKGNGDGFISEECYTSLSSGGGQAGQGYPCVLTAAFSAGAGAGAGSIAYSEQVSPTLKSSASGNMMPTVLCLNDQGDSVMDCSENMASTLRAQEHGHQPLIYENHGIDNRYTGPYAVTPTISAESGTGGNNLPLVAQEIFCITGNAIDRQPQNGGNGIGYQQDIAYTLTATDHHAVFSSEQNVKTDFASYMSKRLIRRLTPLECERLQGFPDGWTGIPGASDAARYRALGNSVAIPCVEYIMRGIARVLKTEKTSG